MSQEKRSPATAGLTNNDFALIEAVFDEVVNLPADARSARLEALDGERPDLRAQIEALLQSHDLADDFLHPPQPAIAADLADGAAIAAPAMGVGSRLGAYRLLQKIGEGGMGEVYLAERADGEFAQRVAIKLTRASVRDADSMRRFRAERQILASLQHPNIVMLLDGGVSAAGDAFLAMEYVDGVPLTRYCADRALPLERRLQLLRDVCAAVQYAHQRGVVHRDLKPANILVTGDGVPKVVDFGIAKLIESSTGAAPTLTGLIPGPLTPNYASPEQLRGSSVTTASDVYGLGVLAYEVISGERPYETAGKGLDEVLALVLDTEPPRPSAPPKHGVDRAVPYPRARLKGDLDAIVLKAMRKEPDARYGSAGELADDVARFMAGQPVIAREPSLGYLLRRLAVRHRAPMMVAAAALVAIVAMLGVALWQRAIAVREQARAEARFREVRQLTNALIFKIHNAVATLAGSTPVRQTIVNEALAYLERLQAESQHDESLQVELAAGYLQIGAILGDPGNANLGDRAGALTQYERARALVLPLAMRPTPDPAAVVGLVNLHNKLSLLLANMGERARATGIAQEGLDAAERLYARAPRPPLAGDLRAKAAFARAIVVRDDEESLPHWQRAMELMQAELAEKPDDPNRMRNVALVEKYLGGQLDELDRDDEAEPHYRRALELDEQRRARDPANRLVQFDVAIDLANVATMIEGQGRTDEALAMFRRSLDLRAQLSSADPRDVLARGRLGYVRTRVARLELQRGDRTEAVRQVRAAIADQEAVIASGATNRTDLAESLLTLGDALLPSRADACGAYARARQTFAALHSTSPSQEERRAMKAAAACDRGATPTVK
jgi:eukaryotic-like serine/threonine-protein kinase